MLRCLVSSARPDLQCAVHQTIKFCNDPKEIHAKVIKRIGRCLKRTKDKGIMFEPNESLGFEDWADTDFDGG